MLPGLSTGKPQGGHEICATFKDLFHRLGGEDIYNKGGRGKGVQKLVGHVLAADATLLQPISKLTTSFYLGHFDTFYAPETIKCELFWYKRW